MIRCLKLVDLPPCLSFLWKLPPPQTKTKTKHKNRNTRQVGIWTNPAKFRPCPILERSSVIVGPKQLLPTRHAKIWAAGLYRPILTHTWAIAVRNPRHELLYPLQLLFHPLQLRSHGPIRGHGDGTCLPQPASGFHPHGALLGICHFQNSAVRRSRAKGQTMS